MKWLIEPEAFPNEPYPLRTTLEDMEVDHVVCKLGVSYEDYTRRIPQNDQLVFHGSKQFAKVIRKNTNWRVFWNTPQYECHYYYPRFGEHLLNHSFYIMLPFGDIGDEENLLLRELWASDRLFMKSDEFKAFGGTIISKKTWQKDMRNLSVYCEPETLIVVAAPWNRMGAEYRLIISDGRVVTGSMYKPSRGPVPDDVIDYAQGVLREVKFNPDPIWTMDVVRRGNNYKVLDVGPFSCCALYESDPEAIIKAVDKILKE